MKDKKGLIILLLIGFSTILNAQIGTFYTADNELISSSLINYIYQDRRNYIWIATEDGLNKYDGVKFTIYKNHPDDSTTIKNNYLCSLFEDSFGRFWIGSFNGLHLYDRATDRFKEVKLYNNNVLISPHITSVIESKNHDIWMTTSGQGIIKIAKDDSVYHINSPLTERLSGIHLTTMIEDQKGRFWIASENQGLNMYDPATDEVVVFKAPQAIGSNQISAICEDKQGNLFVGTLNNGLYKFNPRTQKFELIPDIQGSILSVKCLLLNNAGQLLVGTDGQGIKIYNKEKQRLEDGKMLSAPFDLSEMKVHAILQDKAGNIWIGLFQKGVFFNPENPNKFNYWGRRSYHSDIIGSGCVMSLLKDKEGDLWIGTDNDGIYKLDKQGRSHHLAPGGNSVPYTVLTMIEGDDETIWGGSFLQGLFRLDKKTERCIYYANRLDTTETTAQNKIVCLTKDNRNRLWIGTNGAGIYVFDLKKKEYVEHYSQWSADRFIPNDWINCIRCDESGILWVGSFDGFFNINPDNHQMEDFTKPGALPGKVVYSIHEDKKGNLWLGTPVGLACFDRQSRTSTIYTVQDGLPNNVICDILEDNEENLWLSTHSGISKLKVAEKKFVNYYVFDGLQGNEFSMGAAFKSKDGELFFGGTGGVTSFYPEKITDQRTPLNLYLTGLYLKNKPIVAGQKSGNRKIIHTFISDADTICLSYNDNMFALEFSTFDFGFSERIYYQYRLDGFNSQWITTNPGENRINFTNIDYGTYKLRIKAFIYSNSSEEKVLTIIIRPPWYLSWWAKLIYFILFALLVCGITWFISEKMRHKNELLLREHAEEISEAKLQFFINVSHEIRTPMTLIMGPLEKLLMKNNPIELHNTYLLIYRNAQRILRLINQLMDVRKIDKKQMQLRFRETDMVGFIKDIMQSFEYAAQKKNIDFEFNPEMPDLKVWVDLNNFDKVLFNVFSNAFKFTPAEGKITVELKTGNDFSTNGPLRAYFEIRIVDTGIGIDKEKIEKIFDRFYQINNELTNSNFGTGIGLHLARSLVELQYGIIYAENRTDRSGSCFIIRMPLGKDHLKEEEFEIIPENMPMKTFAYSRKEDLFDVDAPDMETTVRAKTKYRVLIADDDKEINNYIKMELEPFYKITQASTGKEALESILAKKPDLVISDIMMPEMDGITLCRKIKSNVNINYIPVILLTAKSDDRDRSVGLDIDADAYIVKPFNPEILKKTISNLLSNRERLKGKFHTQLEGKIETIEVKAFDDVFMEKILKIINANLSNPKLNVEMLGASVGFSRVHIHRKLKELTGQSARDFIRTIRLEQAKKLLKQKNLTISQVADAVGFVSLSHFSASFREYYGISPKEYMENDSE
ncbi:MAG: response regulator [Candidatus Azobacteroides sp.]|nr:response regulator [Candidatus Azobacteroides sp.]